MRFKFWKKDQIKKQYVEGAVSFFDFAAGYSGDKTGMFAGFGLTEDLSFVDLKTLQLRSLQLARQNPYAAAIINRLVTKIVNSGLRLRAHPLETILNKIVPEGYLDEWGNNVESLYEVWSRDKRLVCNTKRHTMQSLERIAVYTSIISGDCLVISTLNKLGLPTIQLVDGRNLVNPLDSIDKDIKHGVELNDKGVEVAYYVNTLEGVKKVKAYDPSGRRRAWLVGINEKRIDDRRRLPLLSVIMQNINELGKYLDSEQRAALVNSYIAVVHTRGEGNVSTNPLKNAGTTKEFESNDPSNFKRMEPGYFATKLAQGEAIKSFDTSRPNVNFAKFSEYCIKSGSYSVGIPPECLMLEFNSNYSASRQAKLELEDLIKEKTAVFTTDFNQIIYADWLDGMILNGKVKAPFYVKSLNDINRFEILGAWRSASWRGLTKSNVDGLKMVKELKIAQDNGWMTADQIADDYYDNDFATNMRARKKEAQKMREIDVILDPPDPMEELKADVEEIKTAMEEIKC